MSQNVAEGELLWEPSTEDKAKANITRYMSWLDREKGLHFDSYDKLWTWSVEDLEGFWGSIWDFMEVRTHNDFERVLTERKMPGAQWFPGSEINYAEHALAFRDEHPAIISQSETRPLATLTRKQLYDLVSRAALGLKKMGVGKGDRIVAFMPNIPETLVVFLATASIGAIWSACSPEFGARSVVDRFQQVEPTILLATDGYQYGGRKFSRLADIKEIQQQLPTLTHTVIVPYLEPTPGISGLVNVSLWSKLLEEREDLYFEPLPFDHPLWVLYSSGTTGLPKSIVQGHGGILLEHFKALTLHVDLTEDDRFFWFTTTGWMMWNFLIGGLLVGSTVVLYDGSPAYPDMGVLWKLAQDTGTTYFGVSAAYIQSCMKDGLEPGSRFDLTQIRGLGSTGSPLPPEGFRWVYEKAKSDLLLGSISGGTDVCTGFIGSCPVLPVHAGEIQCRYLGAFVDAYDSQGRPVFDEVGELVVRAPMPSMPLFFWNDPDGHRYHESYFEDFPDVWRHGDWIKITRRQSCVMYGRSDSTLNRAGVRMGTSEFYSSVEDMDEVLDSLVIDTGHASAEGRLLLFLVLRSGTDLGDAFRSRIAQKLRKDLSPRHVPDEIHEILSVPRTLSGKKMEVPVRKILMGTEIKGSISQDAMSNPESLRFFFEMANRQGV